MGISVALLSVLKSPLMAENFVKFVFRFLFKSAMKLDVLRLAVFAYNLKLLTNTFQYAKE